MKKEIGLFLVFLFSVNLNADWLDVNMPLGVTDISEKVFGIHMLMFWIMVAIGAVVFGVLFYAMWRYRRSNHKNAAQFEENHKLEIAWTIVPTILLVLMALPASSLLKEMYDHEAEEGGIDIQVIGWQWKWQYKYLDERVGSKPLSFFSNLTTPQEQYEFNQATKTENYLLEVDEELVVPINTPIRFLITSNDVIHSWYMSDFAVKQDAIPGFINVAKTTINKPGIYRGNCTELCGERHAYMPIVVRAVTEEEYQNWLQDHRETAAQLAFLTEREWSQDELFAQGKEVYQTRCAACHQVNGQGIPGFYPALAGSDVVMNDKSKQIEILMEGIRGSQMQSFAEQLNEVEMAAVITFTKLSWDNNKMGSSEIVIPKDIVDYKNVDT
jgi:cytochrome c oxidase subunit 2|tara:strand:- start:22266 stop:23417 length:1152 start_codon:yes stop_codon:yes gene_type:complete